MLQGTGSDVGKSLLVAGLGRAFTRCGLRVLPFKPQNMSNNAAVTVENGEIGRAQALQAQACGVAPSVDMNPVLLKPQTDIGAQVIVHGRVIGNARSREYQLLKPKLLPSVLQSFQRLRTRADLVIVEGAGSAAEVNLRVGDIANMGFATAVGVPVVLVGDIDRGGVIASLCGTWMLLPEPERALIAGFIINKLRGDAELFADGIAVIRRYTGLQSLGVVPWFDAARALPAEDAVALEQSNDRGGNRDRNSGEVIRIAVPIFSRIANFDDLDPLVAEAQVEIIRVHAGEVIPADIDAIILLGSKATIADLELVRTQGWDIDLRAHLRQGGRVLGICGGYQMLGTRLMDPHRVEGETSEAEGLGLIEVQTQISTHKVLRECEGVDTATGAPIRGYQMHMGITEGAATAQPMLILDGQSHGVRSSTGRIEGCYVHGLFVSDAFRDAWLTSIRQRSVTRITYAQRIEATLDQLADHMQNYVDLKQLATIAGLDQAIIANNNNAAPSSMQAIP